MEFSFDVVTAISIVGSVCWMVYSQKKQLKQSRAQVQRQWRIDKISGLVDGFSKILEDGEKLQEQAQRALAGRPRTFNSDDYTAFCASILRYVRITELSFSIWATKEESDVLESIKSLVCAWNNAYVTKGEQALDDRSKLSEIPKFNDLMEGMTDKIKELSSLLRSEVDGVVA